MQKKEKKTIEKVVESIEKMKLLFESGDWTIGRKIQIVNSQEFKKYEGEIKEGKRYGIGKLDMLNGDIFYGEFKDDKFNGQGVYTSADGTIFLGEFRDNIRNGYGILTQPDG